MLKHLFLVLVLAGSYYLWDQKPIKHGVGVTAPDAPVVERGFQLAEHNFKHYTLEPKYRLKTTARVVSNKRYWFDEKAELAPVDFVLGWGELSNERILDQVKTPISRRDYKIDVIRPPMTFNEIRSNLLYMHAIPANETIADQLKSIKTGHIVSIRGFIVDVYDRADVLWTSSRQGNSAKLDNSQYVLIESLDVLE
ncbi:hypothetical protein [Rhodohalobacter barkolensis]|uniref:Uncharacterized protein n=1 Tax=Rhodohalobacter barkolensis TaxID=2053187 RepID=A0A2N0VKZ1_9BACT|nr:hypothetical protein [Rhodohalobacter barkolensis]PKD44811.1 hypothetical protein CWD77_04935 [Rhodohalobacter barkolensis]